MFAIPMEFVFFCLTLAAVALAHRHTLRIAIVGFVLIALYKIFFSSFREMTGLVGFVNHLNHEWVTVANLLGILLGFALLAKKFEQSRLPELLPKYLPAGWRGGFVLLLFIFVLSSFLDNIAAALIGGTIAAGVFQRKLHVGYLACVFH